MRPLPTSFLCSLFVPIAWLVTANGCEMRSGMSCRTDSQCGASAVCIEGLCFSNDTGAPSTACDAGQVRACASSLGEMCLVGELACDGGTWGACMPSAASSDLQSCGASCGPCSSGADRCEQGICKCGGTAACGAGLRCGREACVCDAISCQGCCDGLACRPIGFPVCGSPGGACATCDSTVADGCSPSGGCQCGLGPRCAAGQRCIQGVCACDRTSCPLGCCDGATCRSSSMLSCGIGGALCVSCDPLVADRCLDNGTCACGAGPPCSPGQRCLKGLCICDPCALGSGPPAQAGPPRGW